MKYLKEIIFAIALVLASVLITISISDGKANKKAKKEFNVTTKRMKSTIDSLLVINNSTDKLLQESKQDTQQYKDSVKTYFTSANDLKTSYTLLMSDGYRLSENAKDSLKVCLSASGEQIEESLELQNVIRTQVSVIKTITISLDLAEQSLEEKDFIIERQAELLIVYVDRINILEKQGKKKLLKGIGIGVGIGAVAVILLGVASN